MGNSSYSVVLLTSGFAYWRGLLSFADRGGNNTENSNLSVISPQLNWRRVKRQGLPLMVGETVMFHWQLPRALCSAAPSRVPPPANKVLSLHGSLTSLHECVGFRMQAGSISLHKWYGKESKANWPTTEDLERQCYDTWPHIPSTRGA